MSMTSIRLPESLTGELDRIAARRDITRSELIREALELYVTAVRQGAAGSRGDLIDRLVTYPGSGRGDLASISESVLRERFGARRHRSR